MSVAGCTLSGMNPTIEQILQVFFADRMQGASGADIQRIVVVERVSRACLEEAGPEVIPADALEILNFERALDPRGVFIRTMHADALMIVLPIFVSEFYLLEDRGEVFEQLLTAIGLRHMVVSSGLIDGREFSSWIYDLEVALVTARIWTEAPRP
jgi:hypothetical protein